MTIAITPSAVTATTATLGTAGYGASGTIDLQIASRRDFQFCVAPTYSLPRQASQSIVGLNQLSVNYARARTRLGDGSVEDWGPTVAFRTSAGAARFTEPAQVMIEPAIMVLPEPCMDSLRSPTVAGYPVDNLFRDSPVAMRMLPTGTDSGAPYFILDVRLTGAPIDTLALLNTNLPEASFWYLQGGNVPITVSADILYTANGGAALPFRASPNLPGRPGYHGLMNLGAAQAYPWWRLVVYAPAGFPMLHAEYLAMGLNRATKNFSLDMTETPVPMTTIDRKRSGIPDRVRGLPMRKGEFDLSFLTEAQYETVYRDLIAQENEAVLCVPNSLRNAFFHDRILFGDLSGGRIVNPSSARFTRTFVVNSLI